MKNNLIFFLLAILVNAVIHLYLEIQGVTTSAGVAMLIGALVAIPLWFLVYGGEDRW